MILVYSSAGVHWDRQPLRLGTAAPGHLELDSPAR